MYPLFLEVSSEEVVDSPCKDCPGIMYGACDGCTSNTEPEFFGEELPYELTVDEPIETYDVLPMVPVYPKTLKEVPF